MTVLMRDCVSQFVPVLQQHFPGTIAAGYITGGPGLEWTEAQFGLFARKMRILQRPGLPGEAAQARAIDIERGAAVAGDVPKFLADRAAAGHHDGTVYCDLSNVPSVLGAVGGDLMAVPRWWLAWWWGHPGQPTILQVISELRALTGIDLPPDRLWAVQYVNHQFWDTSVVYGTPDFSRT